MYRQLIEELFRRYDVRNRIASDRIETVRPDERFVFGSNLAGIHGAGTAKLALERFGAKLGVGEGPMGLSYALPTKDLDVKTLPLSQVRLHVDRFVDFAAANPAQKFLVTQVGCGLAGYSPNQIGPMFLGAAEAKNVHLPLKFWHQIIKEVIRRL